MFGFLLNIEIEFVSVKIRKGYSRPKLTLVVLAVLNKLDIEFVSAIIKRDGGRSNRTLAISFPNNPICQYRTLKNLEYYHARLSTKSIILFAHYAYLHSRHWHFLYKTCEFVRSIRLKNYLAS